MEFKIKIESISKRTVSLHGFGFEAPLSTEERPKVENGVSYYLSTEISTSLLAVNGNALEVDAASAPLRDGGFSTSNGVVMYDNTVPAERIDYMDIFAVDDITLTTGESVVFTVSMTFDQSVFNQNVFKNFDASGKCSRRLFFTYDEQ